MHTAVDVRPPLPQVVMDKPTLPHGTRAGIFDARAGTNFRARAGAGDTPSPAHERTLTTNNQYVWHWTFLTTGRPQVLYAADLDSHFWRASFTHGMPAAPPGGRHCRGRGRDRTGQTWDLQNHCGENARVNVLLWHLPLLGYCVALRHFGRLAFPPLPHRLHTPHHAPRLPPRLWVVGVC